MDAEMLTSSKSMESRDNPFTPEGDLSKETEELLRHSIVIRDKFIIDGEGDESINSEQKAAVCEDVVHVSTTQTVEATPNSVQPTDSRKHNGTVDDSKQVDKATDGKDTRNDSSNNTDKKQKKCCAIL